MDGIGTGLYSEKNLNCPDSFWRPFPVYTIAEEELEDFMKREQEANPKLEPSQKGSVLGLEIEELESIVAPLLASNSNETMLSDPEEE
jgi:hypothetical protein